MDKLLNLGIDPWSILLYILNTGVVLAVLTYYLYKPILKFIDQRRAQIISNIEEAQNLQKNFEAKLAESEKRRQEVETELQEEIVKLQKYTEEKRNQMIAEMEQARNDLIQKTNQEITEKKAALIKEAEKEILDIMRKVILGIVEHQIPENVIQQSVESAWKQYVKH